jgi:hypothetical protein
MTWHCKGQGASDKDLEKGRSAMDDQVVQKVKECAVDYLHMRMDDSISVAEIFRNDTTQGFDVSIQGREVPTPQRCIVVVKDGQASILDEPDAPLAFQP